VTKRDAFLSVKTQIEAVATLPAITILDLWTAWHAASTALAAHDIISPDFSSEEKQVRSLVATIHRQLTSLIIELDRRLTSADAKLTQAASAPARNRAQLSIDAVKALLGDDTCVIPRFMLSPKQADEWQNAFDAREALITHASTLHDFPLDDWLYGVARVRPRMHDLETVIQLTAAFELEEPTILPLQFPFNPGEPWLALEIPSVFDLARIGERLSYSAIYTTGGFDKSASAHGGLLLDEWTETIPGIKETAGLAFHYDRPSSEPPQALLLVTPASSNERWNWLDLVGAIPETFDLARKRAVEPRNLSATVLSRFLPATLMAFTSGGISIGSELQVADVMHAFGDSHA
jgi:hypothetical protein